MSFWFVFRFVAVIVQNLQRNLFLMYQWRKLKKSNLLLSQYNYLKFPQKTKFQTRFLHQKTYFPTILPETSGSHTNFSRRICLNGSNPLSFQRFGEIDRFFVCQSACFGRNKRIGCIHAFRIFPKDAQFDKIDLEMLFLAMDKDMYR